MQLRATFERIGFMRVLSLSAAGLIVVLPVIAWAEGAVRLLDCTAARVCDGAGRCEPASMQITFRLEPIETKPDGSGRYTLSYGDTNAELQAVGDAGPFFWMVGSERHTLLASSETQFLWHRLVVEPAPTATVHFLVCTFRQ